MTRNARRVLELTERAEHTAGSLAKELGWSTSQVMRAVHELGSLMLLDRRDEGGVLRYKARPGA